MSSAKRFSWEDHLAIFGGTFDPPHLGHQEAIQSLFKSPGVECVMIVPASGNPLKETLTPFEHRFAMSKLLAESLSKFAMEISPIERDEKIEFTWQLLKSLGQDADQPLAFVAGTDQFLQLEKWARFPEVMSLSDWIFLLRKPNTMKDIAPTIERYCASGWLKHDSSNRYRIQVNGINRVLEIVETPARDISSAEIRKSFVLGKGETTKTHMPEKIYQYIERNNLYGVSRNNSH